MLKLCNKCDELKDTSEFSRNTKASDGLFHSCKDCQRQYREANKERQLAIGQMYRKENRDALLAKAAAHREANRQELSRKSSEWYHRTKQERTAYRRKTRTIRIIKAAVKRSNEKGLPENISQHQAEIISRFDKGVCELSGIQFGDEVKQWNSPTIDRIDSAKGYTMDNVRIICWGLNCAFSTWGENDTALLMTAWLEYRK